jgi:hypothetical protein
LQCDFSPKKPATTVAFAKSVTGSQIRIDDLSVSNIRKNGKLWKRQGFLTLSFFPFMLIRLLNSATAARSRALVAASVAAGFHFCNRLGMNKVISGIDLVPRQTILTTLLIVLGYILTSCASIVDAPKPLSNSNVALRDSLPSSQLHQAPSSEHIILLEEATRLA